MLYSSAGLLALIITLIINNDIIFRKEASRGVPAFHQYRSYLFNILAYYIVDILWGFFNASGMKTMLFIDTSLYFFFMASSILLWTRYAVEYLKQDNIFGKLLKGTGWTFFLFEASVVIINFFFPILFFIDEAGNYQALEARYITLAIQLVIFIMTTIYAFFSAIRCEGPMRYRNLAICMFSGSMAVFLVLQVMYPLLPLYAIGSTLGTCLIHSFVLESEREEYRGTLEQKLEEGIEEGNYYDLLTGLQGMAHFFKSTYERRKTALKEGKIPAFMFVDLSGMKFYNERNTFAKGDKLLQSLSAILAEEYGEENCSRLGSDKFMVFSEEKKVEESISNIFNRWEALNIKDCPAIRVGVYLDRKGDIPIGAACDRAKLARDAIQKSYKSGYKYFDKKMQIDVEKKQYILTHLNQAMEEEWIKVYYQPIVRATNKRVCEEEALARWIDPEKGLIPPDDFIPFLEESNMIYKLDLYVIKQVIKKIKQQEEARLFLVPQSINLSRADFDACDMVEEIRNLIDENKVDHSMISIEITESIIGSDFDFIQEQIDRFRALGFKVWLDDFGSGYSSLDMLQSMRVDLIKFDMRFMQQFEDDKKNRIILTELVKMAQDLGIDTICEGVETIEQVEFLREIGCAKLQGYYFTKPIPMEQILERYEKGIQIGFEDPKEYDYYNSIDRISLYDLYAIAKGDEKNLRNYYNTVPMAIIEVKGNKARFSRSNQSYCDFMKRIFNFDLSGSSGLPFEETPEGPGAPFVGMLRQCCKEGGKAVFNETMPDGTTIRSYMTRIAENPLDGTMAAAVAVLAVMDNKK